MFTLWIGSAPNPLRSVVIPVLPNVICAIGKSFYFIQNFISVIL
jgi:hypothetical protein